LCFVVFSRAAPPAGFSEEFQIPVKNFLRLCIIEFILYHKSIGLKIDDIRDMPKYIKDIIYDFDLISDRVDKIKFKKIDNDFSVIDEIREILTDIKANEPIEPDEPNQYVSTNSRLEPDEYFAQEQMIDDLNEEMRNDYESDYYYPRESIKYEFLINFWPYVIDEIGKGTNLISQLDSVSEKSPPFGLMSYEENINDFYKQKQSMIINQWSKRKLNFEPAISFSLEELRTRMFF